MRTYTTTHTVYNFDELSDEAKQKAFEYFRENEQFEWLGDDLQYKLVELLAENKIKYEDEPKIHYSLNYCQGDGAMFTGTVFWKHYRAEMTHSGRYYHEYSADFELLTTYGNEVKQSVYDEFTELYRTICKEITKYGYDCIEANQSDENIIDMIRANEYEFNEDGSIA